MRVTWPRMSIVAWLDGKWTCRLPGWINCGLTTSTRTKLQVALESTKARRLAGSLKVYTDCGPDILGTSFVMVESDRWLVPRRKGRSAASVLVDVLEFLALPHFPSPLGSSATRDYSSSGTGLRILFLKFLP